MQAYHSGTFLPVAWVSISRPSTGYAKKYGFKLNTAPPQHTDVNALFLCYDDGIRKCRAHPKHACSPTHDHTDGPNFYARLGRGPTTPLVLISVWTSLARLRVCPRRAPCAGVGLTTIRRSGCRVHPAAVR